MSVVSFFRAAGLTERLEKARKKALREAARANGDPIPDEDEEDDQPRAAAAEHAPRERGERRPKDRVYHPLRGEPLDEERIAGLSALRPTLKL